MKSINVILSLLLASSSSTTATEQTTEQTNLRHNEQRELAYASRAQGWVGEHNKLRLQYHTELGAPFSPLKWSNALKKEAAKLAKSMALDNDCNIYMPEGMQYGINMNARKGYPNVPTTKWILESWEENIDDNEKNGPIVQALWSGSKYLGCADVYNKDITKRCSVSICLYGKGGNCNMHHYSSWEEAIIEGPGCGECPPDKPAC